MRHVRAAALLAAALAAGANAAVVTSSTARGFLAQLARPDLIASKMAKIEDDWRAQARIFTACNAGGDVEQSVKLCGRVHGQFQQSCAAIATAFIKGQKGDPHAVAVFMDNLCAQSAGENDHRPACLDFREELLKGMSTDSQDPGTASTCHRLWLRLLKKGQEDHQAANMRGRLNQSHAQPLKSRLEGQAKPTSTANALPKPHKGDAQVAGAQQQPARAGRADSASAVLRGKQAVRPPSKDEVKQPPPSDKAGLASIGRPAVQPRHEEPVPVLQRASPSATAGVQPVHAELQGQPHAEVPKPAARTAPLRNAFKAPETTAPVAAARRKQRGAADARGPGSSEAAEKNATEHSLGDQHHKAAKSVKAEPIPDSVVALHNSEARRQMSEDHAAQAQKVLEQALAAEKRIQELSAERRKRRAIEERKRLAAEARKRRQRLREIHEKYSWKHTGAGKAGQQTVAKPVNSTPGKPANATPHAVAGPSNSTRSDPSKYEPLQKLGAASVERNDPGAQPAHVPTSKPVEAVQQKVANLSGQPIVVEEHPPEELSSKGGGAGRAAQGGQLPAKDLLLSSDKRMEASAEGELENEQVDQHELDASDEDEGGSGSRRNKRALEAEEEGESSDVDRRDRRRVEARSAEAEARTEEEGGDEDRRAPRKVGASEGEEGGDEDRDDQRREEAVEEDD